MSKKVFCKKFQKEMPALIMPPMPGPKGQEVLENVSQEAWELWKSHQTTLINEKHLDMSDPENRLWLIDQMDKFFCNEDYEKASGFKALD
jgi:Fe-S cluster biosynthesis and repair protein YggX